MGTSERPVALVTGGSRGIGRSVVERLAADGYDVAFCFRSSPEAAADTAAKAEAAGARVLARRADVSVAAEARTFVAEAADELGALSAVVTCAGVVRDTPLLRMSEDEWSEVLRTNLDGTYHICRAAVFSLMKQHAGSVITLSSVAGVYGNAMQTNYAASKSGIIGFTRSLAREVGRFGVRANVVAPGLIDTEMTADVPAEAREELLGRIPLQRAGAPEEVADLVSFLVSDRAGYISGQVLGVDGGLVV